MTRAGGGVKARVGAAPAGRRQLAAALRGGAAGRELVGFVRSMQTFVFRVGTGCALAALALGCASDGTYPSGERCDDDVSSAKPCIGLLPTCAAVGVPRGLTRPLVAARSECGIGTFSGQALVSQVVPPGRTSSGVVTLALDDPACEVWLEVGVREPTWPVWPWLASGARFDVALKNTGSGGHGGFHRLALTLRDPDSARLLLIIYQLGDPANEEIVQELGFDVERVGPTCERGGNDRLSHGFELRFSTPGESLVLGPVEDGSLPTGDGPSAFRIQTGSMVDVKWSQGDEVLLDYVPPMGAQFVAWPEL